MWLKFSNIHLLLKMQIDMTKLNKVYASSICNAIAIMNSKLHLNITIYQRATQRHFVQGSHLKSHVVIQYLI